NVGWIEPGEAAHCSKPNLSVGSLALLRAQAGTKSEFSREAIQGIKSLIAYAVGWVVQEVLDFIWRNVNHTRIFAQPQTAVAILFNSPNYSQSLSVLGHDWLKATSIVES